MIEKKVRKSRKKSIQVKSYVIINSDLKYFSGFRLGGKFRWVENLEEAKRFDDEHKFNAFKKWCSEEIIIDWINI